MHHEQRRSFSVEPDENGAVTGPDLRRFEVSGNWPLRLSPVGQAAAGRDRTAAIERCPKLR